MSSWTAIRALPAVMAITIGNAGCQMMVDPFVDELASQGAVTTPSVEGVRLANTTARTDVSRSYENMYAEAQDGTVTYGPLYFADIFETKEDDDGRYAWRAKDFLLFFHGQVQFLANGIAMPLSAVIAPPWREMNSAAEPRWARLGCIPIVRLDDSEPVGG
jgi:hypothetical protein